MLNEGMRLALYQPDIPQNAGTILRMAACLGLPVDLILPTGFDASDRAFKRSGLDYLAHVEIVRHASWEAFEAWRASNGLPHEGGSRRLVLLTTRAEQDYLTFQFQPNDILLLGRESAGVPDAVHLAATAHIKVAMRPGLRSLNVAVAAAMVTGEALRQLGPLF